MSLFLSLLVSGVGCGTCLWLYLDFSVYFFTGITRTTLKKVLGKACISYQALHTVLTEEEAVINDRPLTYVAPGSNDPEPLTPSNLLYCRRITMLPYDNRSDSTMNPEVAGNHARAHRTLVETCSPCDGHTSI